MTIYEQKMKEKNSVYVIAEMSANHNGSIETAKEIIHAMKEAGADCVKVQTYTADTITMDCRNEYFLLKGGTWDGQNLHDLYKQAYMPWEWQGELKKEAESVGLDFFSTPFDPTSVDFLESIDIPFYKIASFEVVDIPLIKKVAATGKPIIMSVGMASLAEIDEAVSVIKSYGNDLALLKCSSAYPAVPEKMNLKTICHLRDTYQVPVGLSDHSMGSVSAVTAVALGARIIEKHFCLSREFGGPDSSFSMEPDEFKQMVEDVQMAAKAVGEVAYRVSEEEKSNYAVRKSIFVSKDIKKGEILTPDNIRVVRPGYGMSPKFYEEVLGRKAIRDIAFGEPLDMGMFGGKE
ncbi:MAG: pseudaminic acid synthase [Lachnospiraceae bacterium]|nr:pseudaminic acid synthase [Lachnospiraceae bacterium]